MKIEEALNIADDWVNENIFPTGELTSWQKSLEALAAEVRRLQAVEAVPFGYASTDLDGVPNKDGDDLIVKDAPFYCSDKQDCIPLYTHPPALDDDTRNQSEGKLEMVDDDTKKLVLELCDLTMLYADYLPCSATERAEALKEKLGVGDE